MEDYIYMQHKEHGTLKPYSIKSIEDYNNIQYKDYGGPQLYIV